MAGGDYLVRTDKAVYRGGETMRVPALGGGREPVFVDLVSDGQTVLSESIAMRKRPRRADSSICPPELSGTIELCAYRYGPEGFPVHKTRVIYIEPGARADDHDDLDRAEYRPGGGRN